MRFASLTIKAITKIATPSGTLPISNHKYPPLPELSSNMDVPLMRDVIKARAMGRKATIRASFIRLNLAWGNIAKMNSCLSKFWIGRVLRIMRAFKLLLPKFRGKRRSSVEIYAKHISHKLIDSLSDGVFSIALTLLGLDVVGLVHDISKSEDFNAALFSHWPTFLAYFLGFFVLLTWWYNYHVTGQYVVGTSAFIVWNHGITMAWVALMPFGVAILAENLNTPNMKWGVFYFGIALFGQYWSWLLQWTLTKLFRGNHEITFTEDFILSQVSSQERNKFLFLFNLGPALIGLVLGSLSLLNPWLALAGYTLFVATLVNPVNTLNKFVGPRFAKMLKL